MKQNNIKITVVIPVFNQERFIRQAIDSALNQTYRNYEIMVIDDGSTDRTPEILKSYGSAIRIIKQTNSGTSAAWNTAIQSVKTDYLIGLDSDDEFVPSTIEKTILALILNPAADIIYSDYEFINSDSRTTKIVHNPEALDPVKQLICLHDRLGQPDNFLPFGHVRLYRRQALIDVGGYDPTYLYAEDFDLVLRLAEYGASFVHVPEVLYCYRWHDTNKGVAARSEQIVDVRRSVRIFKERNFLT